MNHSEFVKKWIWKSYQETPELWIQCVGGVKIYAKERKWNIWTFWGSAINGWNTWLPFDSSWTRIEYKPWLFPPQWALIFFSEKRCKNWHVSLANKYCNKDVLRHLDQNWWGKWDPFTHRFSDYKNVLWFYIHK